MSISTIPDKEARLLFTLSGNLCAFPGCNIPLTEMPTDADPGVNVSDICHIVADSRHGPRGRGELSSDDRQKHSNLVLFCPRHHRIVDSQPRTFSVPVLQKMKRDHSARVAALRPSDPPDKPLLVSELLHSTAMAVTHMPAKVFSAPCKYPNDPAAVARAIVYPRDQSILTSFILRDGRLYSFVDLTTRRGPFQDVINSQQVNETPIEQFWDGDEGERRLVNLLNQTMSRDLRRFGIAFDKSHKRYFFGQEVVDEERTFPYRPLNAGERTMDVAFRAMKRTGEFKGFWWHKAVSLRFDKVGTKSIYLSIRPERHLTTNGRDPLPPEKIGRRVTSLKARMFNDKYMAEIQFWRDVLCEGKPRLLAGFGSQSLIVDSQLMTFTMNWPGVPDDTKNFKNQQYEDDLFTTADLEAALEGRSALAEESDFDDAEDE